MSSRRSARNGRAPQPGSARGPASRRAPPASSGGAVPSSSGGAGLSATASTSALGMGRSRPRPGQQSSGMVERSVGYRAPHSQRREPADVAAGIVPVSLGEWRSRPQHRTKSDLERSRAAADRPDPSYDVDNDGVVSAVDYKLARHFDVNHDGVLDQHELMALRKELAHGTVGDYLDMPHGQHVKTMTAQMSLGTGIDQLLKEKINRHDLSAAELRSMYDEMDADGSGSLDMHELTQLCDQHNLGFSDDDMRDMVDHMDGDRSGHVDFEEFATWMRGDGKLRQIFNQIDDDASGKLDVVELGMLCQQFGLTMNREQLADMVQEIDGNGDGDGHIDFDEFSSWLRKAGGGGAPSSGALGMDQKTVAAIFEKADVDGSGKLDRDEIAKAFSLEGIRVTKEELDVILRKMDNSEGGADGEVDIGEFSKWLLDPDSKAFHHHIERIVNKTRSSASFNSRGLQRCMAMSNGAGRDAMWLGIGRLGLAHGRVQEPPKTKFVALAEEKTHTTQYQQTFKRSAESSRRHDAAPKPLNRSAMMRTRHDADERFTTQFLADYQNKKWSSTPPWALGD